MRADMGRFRVRASRALAAASLLVACRVDPVGPGEAAVAGSYHATAFLTIEGGQRFDHIANGSTINIVLTAQGTTTGTMHFEAAGGDPGFDVSLAGTWELDQWWVTFDHAADTFLRDLQFTYNGDHLAAEDTFSGTQVIVTLRRD